METVEITRGKQNKIEKHFISIIQYYIRNVKVNLKITFRLLKINWYLQSKDQFSMNVIYFIELCSISK